MAISLSANAFLSALTNLIAYTFVVPQFKDGDMDVLLSKCKYDDAPSGDGVVFRSAGVGAPANLNPNASSLLSVNAPSGATEQHIPITEYKVIPLTVNKRLLAQAFVSETGLSDYVAATLKGMETTKKFDIFTHMAGIIDAYVPTATSGNKTVNVFDVSGLTDPNQLAFALDRNSKILLKEIAKDSKAMRYLTANYNDAAAPQVVDKDDLYLICTEDTRLGIDFDTLATNYNAGYISANNGWSGMVSIPDAYLPTWITNHIGCMLVHRDKFVYGFLYQFAGMFFDLSNLNEQHFMHYAFYADAVDAVPAVAYTISASITPAALS